MGPIFRPSHFERNQVFIIKEPSKKGAMVISFVLKILGAKIASHDKHICVGK